MPATAVPAGCPLARILVGLTLQQPLPYLVWDLVAAISMSAWGPRAKLQWPEGDDGGAGRAAGAGDRRLLEGVAVDGSGERREVEGGEEEDTGGAAAGAGGAATAMGGAATAVGETATATGGAATAMGETATATGAGDPEGPLSFDTPADLLEKQRRKVVGERVCGRW